MKKRLISKPQIFLLGFILVPILFTLIPNMESLFSSETLTKRILEEKCKGLVRVIRIDKILTEERKESGDQILIIQYDAVITFPQNTIFEMSSRKGFQEAIVRIEKGTENYYNFVKGKVIKIKNGIFILRKENGRGRWQLI